VFYELWSNVAGFRSFRNTQTGSWYLNALTRVFAERACNTDVAAMLRLVRTVTHTHTRTHAFRPVPRLARGGGFNSTSLGLRPLTEYFQALLTAVFRVRAAAFSVLL